MLYSCNGPLPLKKMPGIFAFTAEPSEPHGNNATWQALTERLVRFFTRNLLINPIVKKKIILKKQILKRKRSY